MDSFMGGINMYEVSEKWKSGDVTHRTFNDPYRIEKHYTIEEIKNLYKDNPNIKCINIAKV